MPPTQNSQGMGRVSLNDIHLRLYKYYCVLLQQAPEQLWVVP